MERTMHNGELRLSDVGKEVTLLGWVANRRNLGSLVFIDLRDASGTVQLIAKDPSILPDIRNEYVVEARGVVEKKDVPNPALKTGEIEVTLHSLKVISKANLTPFIIADKTDALEETRLKYRYLDLRRPCLLHNLRVRAEIVRCWHEYFGANGFLEVETPILNLATPEGARDYLVPSRLHHGSFYALPQSPQLWKQLLMIGGVERYYQVAKCFRDEDLRADRQPEFTQLDEEVSFMDQDQILTLNEGFLQKVFRELLGVEIALPLRRMPYWEAMDVYGSDKPDTRYGLLIQDLHPLLSDVPFDGFRGVPFIKGIVVPGVAKETSRKVLDELQVEARKFRLKGVLSLKMLDGTLQGSFTKFLSEEKQVALISELGLKEGDLLLFASSDDRRAIDFGLGALRTLFAKKLGLVKPGTYDLLWVVNFPMFDPIEGQPGVYSAEHHPFTRPRDEDLPFLESDPERVLAYAYDIVINGYECGGGTLRIFDHDTQWKIFNLLGLSDEDVAKKFGWFIDAFQYGVPPHGGMAYGLDRLTMILCGTDNIRDVIAFPKNLQAVDPTSKAPAEVSEDQLDVLGIQLKEEE
ncbi:MAG: aspartate--tRNA ligase [Bacillales bacterium]|nr:aspartate--tRNA ligase [Bacillales bacterium]MDY5919475.1 aspartate--tRNA ligase [Candidatus Enteromonas sp.]